MIQHRPILGCQWILCLIAIGTAARAEVTYTETDDRTGDSLTVIHMKVTPAAEPVPALRHRLLARDIELEMGNAAAYYRRAIIEATPTVNRLRKEYGDEFDNWYDTSDGPTIAQLPLEKVRKADQVLENIVQNHLAIATSRSDCDWELGLEQLRGTEVISFLLPEFQECRQLSRILLLRTRLAVAERRYDDAIATMRMNYRLGQDAAQPPLLVCGLIGIAIESMTNGTLLELIASPDSPNLYWSLTELPAPLVDMRQAVRFELDFGPRIFPFIHHADSADRAPQEWNRLYRRAFLDLAAAGEPGLTVRNDLQAGVVATMMALIGYAHAKSQLIAQGMDRARVEQMAVGQVIAIYTERNYQRFANDFEKLWYVPFWEMRARGEGIPKQLGTVGSLSGNVDREVFPIVSLLLPAMQAARAAQVRLERDITAMRVIEALRMHAAARDGRLPKRLNDIDAVPIPLNPATGKPFLYRLEGRTAILELPSADGTLGYSRRFEIEIATTNE